MAKKKAKAKLPKEILGVKLPKDVRKVGNQLIEQARSDAGRQAIAGALTAVAGAAATAVAAKAFETAQRQRPTEPGAHAPDGKAVAAAVEKGVEHLLGKLFGAAR